MRFGFCLFSVPVAACLAFSASPASAFQRESGSGTITAVGSQLPDAPPPPFEIASADSAGPPPTAGKDQSAQPPAQSPPQAPDLAAQGASGPQPSAQPPPHEKSQYEKGEEQIKEQEKQRVVGILPSFNVSYRADAVSLTAGQKMRLALRSSVDPVTVGAAFLIAGYHEALDDDPGFGWGLEGYGKRSGAAYLDLFNGTMIGNGVLPAILHQEPRFFRLGHGTVTHRLLYALATNVVCKHDNTGKWEPNYSNIGGNIASGAISNLYYPKSNSDIGQTFSNGFIVTAEGGIGSIFQEFWPDISRKFLHKDPTHGLDAQARALDAAEKQAKRSRQ
jgi:hypothetical protein